MPLATTKHSGIPAHSRAAMAALPGPSLRGMSSLEDGELYVENKVVDVAPPEVRLK